MDINKDECQHEPDLEKLSLLQDIPPVTSDDRIEFIIDVNCSKCGTSGSFVVIIKLTDICW